MYKNFVKERCRGGRAEQAGGVSSETMNIIKVQVNADLQNCATFKITTLLECSTILL